MGIDGGPVCKRSKVGKGMPEWVRERDSGKDPGCKGSVMGGARPARAEPWKNIKASVATESGTKTEVVIRVMPEAAKDGPEQPGLLGSKGKPKWVKSRAGDNGLKRAMHQTGDGTPV